MTITATSTMLVASGDIILLHFVTENLQAILPNVALNRKHNHLHCTKSERILSDHLTILCCKDSWKTSACESTTDSLGMYLLV